MTVRRMESFSMTKLIITAALTGSRITRDASPFIPISPEELVQSAVECWNAGAAAVHIHVRDPGTGLGTQNVEIFRRVVEPLRARTRQRLARIKKGARDLYF